MHRASFLGMNGQDFRLDSDQRGFNVESGIRRFSGNITSQFRAMAGVFLSNSPT